MRNKIILLFIFCLVIVGSWKSQTVTISPNPFDKRTLASFTLAGNDTVTLEIYHLTGKTVKSIYLNTYLLAGTYNDSIFLDNSPPGIYLVLFKTKIGDSKPVKIIKQGAVGLD